MTSTSRCELPAQDKSSGRWQESQWSWARLDQGLRATDLLLQAGGFAAIVLDLGDTAPEQASRIPLATWFRYRQAAERTQCSLVVIGKRAYAQSAASVVLECEAEHVDVAGEDANGGTVLCGFQYAVRRGRERFAPVEIGTRKPPAATWQAEAAWDAERNKCGESKIEKNNHRSPFDFDRCRDLRSGQAFDSGRCATSAQDDKALLHDQIQNTEKRRA